MTKYESLFQHLKQHFVRFDAFNQRGRRAIETILQGFFAYLEAPHNTGRMCRIGADLNDTTTYPPGELAELRPDGKFVGCLTVSEASGLFLRFPFFVRVDGEWFELQSGEPETAKVFRVQTLDASSLSEFYEHTLAQAFEFLDTSPEKIASGDLKRPIGFVWPQSRG
jgi:hypothetical protein